MAAAGYMGLVPSRAVLVLVADSAACQGSVVTACMQCSFSTSAVLSLGVRLCVQNVLLLLSRSELQVLRSSFTTWRGYTTYRQQKAAADEFAASKLQDKVLLAWRALACVGSQKAAAAGDMFAQVQARTRRQLLLDSMLGWKEYAAYRKQKAAADEYAVSKLQHSVFLAWLKLANEAAYKQSVAASMAAGVLAKSQLLLRRSCLVAWQEWAAHRKALTVG